MDDYRVPLHSPITSRYTEALVLVMPGAQASSGCHQPQVSMTSSGRPRALERLTKGDLATITGRLAYEVSETNGVQQKPLPGYFNLFAFKVDAAGEDCLY